MQHALCEVLQAVQAHVDRVKLANPHIWPEAARELEAATIEEQRLQREIIESEIALQKYWTDVVMYEVQQLEYVDFPSPTSEEDENQVVVVAIVDTAAVTSAFSEAREDPVAVSTPVTCRCRVKRPSVPSRVSESVHRCKSVIHGATSGDSGPRSFKRYPSRGLLDAYQHLVRPVLQFIIQRRDLAPRFVREEYPGLIYTPVFVPGPSTLLFDDPIDLSLYEDPTRNTTAGSPTVNTTAGSTRSRLRTMPEEPPPPPASAVGMRIHQISTMGTPSVQTHFQEVIYRLWLEKSQPASWHDLFEKAIVAFYQAVMHGSFGTALKYSRCPKMFCCAGLLRNGLLMTDEEHRALCSQFASCPSSTQWFLAGTSLPPHSWPISRFQSQAKALSQRARRRLIARLIGDAGVRRIHERLDSLVFLAAKGFFYQGEDIQWQAKGVPVFNCSEWIIFAVLADLLFKNEIGPDWSGVELRILVIDSVIGGATTSPQPPGQPVQPEWVWDDVPTYDDLVDLDTWIELNIALVHENWTDIFNEDHLEDSDDDA
ncbi:hypothetical protein CALCODRAFT_507072 [Calocera cornea HHB12733]|uniref:Uncharacterized protein n=1 Tax=Calocera cornea HHB12733 TaxID=1353952 RepID=A0A165I373_9BASI|nr:hypothetical protein CALCODRAFT_507072 [Calocera cornea HHB12733]